MAFSPRREDCVALTIGVSSEGMDETSLSLLDRVRGGKGQVWGDFTDLYRPLLMRWAARYGAQVSDADDLAQDVLLVVVAELPDFEHNRRPGAFRNWLRTILVNRLREFWRSNKRKPLATGETGFLRRLEELADASSGASQEFAREHDEYVMKKLLDATRGEFQPTTWRAFRRQVIDGVRADRVAEELGMSLGAVYAAKSRVLSALRRQARGLIDAWE